VSTGSEPGDIVISGDAMFVYVTSKEGDKVSVYKLSYSGTGTYNGSIALYPTLVLHNEIAMEGSIVAPADLVIDPMNMNLFVVNSGEVTHESSLAVIKICCGPVAPSSSIGELVITIQTMINLDIIQETFGIGLIGHLNSALANYSDGKTKTAINNLNAFINKVKALVNSHRITKEQGQALIDAANAIIAQMGGRKSDLTESSSYGNRLFNNSEVINCPELSDNELISVSKMGVIYPNPFSESVVINYEIAENNKEAEKVLIRVYDISGRLVGTLVNKTMQGGRYTVLWKGNYESGRPAPYGTYILYFKTGNIEEVREIMLMR
jgi:hypothetical protein